MVESERVRLGQRLEGGTETDEQIVTPPATPPQVPNHQAARSEDEGGQAIRLTHAPGAEALEDAESWSWSGDGPSPSRRL